VYIYLLFAAFTAAFSKSFKDPVAAFMIGYCPQKALISLDNVAESIWYKGRKLLFETKYLSFGNFPPDYDKKI